MSSVNKVIVVGHLGNDPDSKKMDNGDYVTNISVATSETWKDNRGDKQERTEWHRIVAYRKLAEIMADYLKKGALVYIEGKLQTRKWTDKDGVDRYTTEIIANSMQMLGGRDKDDDRSRRDDRSRDRDRDDDRKRDDRRGRDDDRKRGRDDDRRSRDEDDDIPY